MAKYLNPKCMDTLEYENLKPKQAIALQKEMRQQISLHPLNKSIKLIGGADISFNKNEKTVYAGIVILSFPELQIVNSTCVISETNFPYISGLLAFREIPALLQAWNNLSTKPDVMVLDGQGIAHERRMGIATHFGILTKVPSIGCAKSRLKGVYKKPLDIQFAESKMYDKDEEIGIALRSKLKCKPIFISPGYGVSLKQSIEIIKQCITKYRIPEPTRLAHHFVNDIRIKHMPSNNSAQINLF